MNHSQISPDQRLSLLDILDGLLKKGVCIKGDLLISIANIDLVYIDLRLLVTAVESLKTNPEKDIPRLIDWRNANGDF
jgi:hypothetical protein